MFRTGCKGKDVQVPRKEILDIHGADSLERIKADSAIDATVRKYKKRHKEK